MALSEYSKYGNAAAELASAVKENRVAHAYLIEGEGCSRVRLKKGEKIRRIG